MSERFVVHLLSRFLLRPDVSFALFKQTELPFVPHVGMMLGLEAESWFDQDQNQIKRVLYLSHSNRFLVELEGNLWNSESEEDFWECVQSYLDDGWALSLSPDSFSNEEGAIEWASDSAETADSPETAVKARGRYHSLNKDELRVLRMKGEPFEVLTPIAH